MFFLFGSPRSGTTLLARMLNAHPRILVPHETDFIVPMAFACDRLADPALGRRVVADLIVGGKGFAGSLGEFIDESEVRRLVDAAAFAPGAILDTLYAHLAARQGKRLAGDKSPNDLNFVRILHKTGVLDAPRRMVHLVRDVRDVATSLQRTGWAPQAGDYFARQWSNANLYLHAVMRDAPERYLLVRYEDLVRDPERVIRRICAHLAVGFDPVMLDPAAHRHARYDTMPQHARIGSGIVDASVGQYRTGLPPALLAACETQAAEALEAFGYGASRSTP